MIENLTELYLDEIGRTALLTEEQEQQLSARALKGDKHAIDKLVEANLRLVVSTARQYQHQGMSIDDLISEGNIGLMKAAAKYDATRGQRFAPFATVFIRRQIEKSLKANSNADSTAVARTGNVAGSNAMRSLDAPLGAKPNKNLLSVLTDDKQAPTDSRLFSAASLETIESALNTLNDRENKVIVAYFGIDREHATMNEIATEMQLSRERVRQIRDRAIRRLKKAVRNRQ